MNYVILLADGSGIRMNAPIAKQHINIGGHQIIEYTLHVFEKSKSVDRIIVVSNPVFIKQIEKLQEKYSKLVNVIVGGSSRSMSVYNAINHLAIYCDDNDKVVLSDAVRPCITSKEIEECFLKLDSFPAVTTGVEVYETILRTANQELVDIIQN